jgi:hypothetical protein
MNLNQVRTSSHEDETASPGVSGLMDIRLASRDNGADECADCGWLFFNLVDGRCMTCRLRA